MTKKANLTMTDRFQIEIRSKEYCDETFGEDYFEDYSIDIPLEIYVRAEKLQKEMEELQKILFDIYNKHEKS